MIGLVHSSDGMTIIKIEIRVVEEVVIVDVHHEIPRINHQINQTLQGRINNNVIIMIIEIRIVQNLQKMEIRMLLLPRMVRITNHKKIKMTVRREALVMIVRLRRDGIEIKICHQDGVTETSMAAVVDDEEIEIVHEVDHAVANGIDHTVENVIEIDRVGRTGIDDLIVHIEIITGQGLDHVKGQGREVEEEEETIIIIEGLPDQIGIVEDHTVGQGHVNVDLEVEKRSLLIIEAVVAVVVGGEIDQDQ